MRGAAPLEPAERLGEITRPRVDGHAFERLGKRGVPTTVITESDVDDVGAAMDAFQALQATLVTVVDVDGQSHANVLVLNVAKMSSRKVLSAQGGLTAGAWMLTVQWQLQPTDL